jgi:hypothetical protein
MSQYSKELSELLRKEAELTEKIRQVFKSLGWEV